jgi:hypothetical protein
MALPDQRRKTNFLSAWRRKETAHGSPLKILISRLFDEAAPPMRRYQIPPCLGMHKLSFAQIIL